MALVKRKANSLVLKRDRIKEIFNSLQIEKMDDPSILSTEAYKMAKEDYEAAIYAGPTYTGCPAERYIQIGRSISNIFFQQKSLNIYKYNTSMSVILVITSFFH